ncbi:MAG: hypothetical protein VR64_14920 [Desulfatitalea sp. BRH_c12]|nr:MAG: hypothetical protein VR64_14920 [Desulfatitalea sp. BRH_c12]
MFSNRFDWLAPDNALGRLIAQKRAAGDVLLDLTQSNPTRVGLQYESDTILAALASPAAITYLPDPHGIIPARRAVAEYYRPHGAPLDPERLFLTASTSDAYALLFKLLADAGDEVLIPSPGYPLLSYLTRFEALRPIAYPLRYDDADGWTIDMDVLEALITPRTRAVVLVNPNNPTGSYVKHHELSILDAICRRHDLALIVDEVFADYAAADAPATRVATALDATESLCFVLNGFSKLVALPQVKLGWILLSGQAAAVHAAGQRLETLLDFYLSISTPVQHAAQTLLSSRQGIQQQINLRIAANEQFLQRQIAKTRHCRLLRREGGWYAVVDFTDTLGDEERILDLLAHTNTVVHPGYFYDFHREGFVVISLLPREEVFCKGVRHLLSAGG